MFLADNSIETVPFAIETLINKWFQFDKTIWNIVVTICDTCVVYANGDRIKEHEY